MTQPSPISQQVLYCAKLPAAVDFALSVLTSLSEEERKTYGRGVSTPEEIHTLVSGVVAFRLKNAYKLAELNSESTRELLASTFYDLTALYVSLFNRFSSLCESALSYLNGSKGAIEHSRSELLYLKCLSDLTKDMKMDLKTFQAKTLNCTSTDDFGALGSDMLQFEMTLLKSQTIFDQSLAKRVGDSLARKWLGASGNASSFIDDALVRLQPFTALIEQIITDFNLRIETIDQHQAPGILEVVEEAFFLYSCLCLSRESLVFKDFPKNDGSGYFIDSFTESASRLPLNLFFGNSHAQRIALRNSTPGTWQRGNVPYQSFTQAFFEAHGCFITEFFDTNEIEHRKNRVLWRSALGLQSNLF